MNPNPSPTTIRGPAFPLGVRLLASLLVAGLLYWAVRSHEALAGVEWNGWTAAVVGGALVLVLWCLAWMWRSQTWVDAQGIGQSWIRDKRVAWQDISQARLVALPYLDPLITPRLVVRPRGGGIVVFHCADRRVLQVFAAYITTGLPPLQPVAE